jgi:endonuclease/exonuclease/phosphatase family metal-dependent hydrolase
MTRVVSYNILAGGYNLRENGRRRTQELTTIIRSAQPDIVGIIEATNIRYKEKPTVIEEVAENLGMQLTMGGEQPFEDDYRIALMTRLPIIDAKIHARPYLLTKPLLEVCVEEANGQQLTVFVTHLSAAFSRGRGGGHLRIREAHEILKIMEPLRQQHKPHFLMGDFNSLGPDDAFEAHRLLSYIVQMEQTRDPKVKDGVPHFDSVTPPQLRFLKPLLRIIPENALLSSLFDWAAALYAPRSSIGAFKEAGYIDCYRNKHPNEHGFTCPAANPAGRIDYIFASPNLAERLETCYPIVNGDGLPGSQASDHLALAAEFVPAAVQLEQPVVEARPADEIDSAVSL